MPATHIILAHTIKDAQYAINYSISHPRLKVLTFPTHLNALTYLSFHPHLLRRLDQYIRRTSKIHRAVDLPYQIMHQTISRQPQLTIWSELIRHHLAKNLSQGYVLSQLIKRTSCRRLLVSPQSFSAAIVQQVAKFYGVPLTVLSDSSKWWSGFSWLRQWTQIRFFTSHLSEFISGLTYLFKQQPHKNQFNRTILVFSQGLHLASYHSVFKLLQHLPQTRCLILTPPQSISDKLYLAKYQLITKILPSFKVNTSPPPLFIAPQIASLLFSQKQTGLFPRQLLSQLINFSLTSTLDRYSPLTSQIAMATKIVDRYKPSLLITTHDPGPSALSFVLAAKSKHIPTVSLLHGTPSHVHFFYSDCQIVWGPLTRLQLIKKAKISPPRLKLGGYPIYTDYAKFFRHSPRLPQKPLTIGVITSGDGQYEWHQAYYFFDLLNTLSKLTIPFRLLVRSHPMQTLSGIRQLAANFRIALELNPPLHLEEFVSRCHIVITQNSTAALVPLIAGKPTIMIDPWFPFLDEGLIKYSSVFLKIKHWDQLPKLIDKIFLNKPDRHFLSQQSQFITNSCGPLNDKIGEKIVSHIAKKLTTS